MQLKDIKRLYRLYMNGVVSQSMRNKGADYRVNFGLTMPLLRRIAEQVSPSVDIAEELWQNRGVRESMLLAPMLYPISKFSEETARKWVAEMPNVEVSDFCCKFLFSQLSFAHSLVLECMKEEREIEVYTGFRLAYSLLSKEVSTEWLREVASEAVEVLYQGGSIAMSAAQRFLSESLMADSARDVVLDTLRQMNHIDREWRENIIEFYGAK